MQEPKYVEITPEQCRNTQWRQGHVIPAAIASALGLDASRRFIIISHDCDLTQPIDVEPYIEVIGAQMVGAAAPSFRLAENPRLLHLDMETATGEPEVLELKAADKQPLAKSRLYELEFPEPPPYRLPVRLLQSWLACRYRRHALPNALNDRLSKVYDKLKDTAKRKPSGVIATWIQFDPDEEVEADDIYEVSFTVVYETHNVDGMANANAMAERLNTAMKKAEGIEFMGAMAEPDTSFTKFRELQMWEWRLEFISFRDGAEGSLSERGQ